MRGRQEGWSERGGGKEGVDDEREREEMMTQGGERRDSALAVTDKEKEKKSPSRSVGLSESGRTSLPPCFTRGRCVS